MTKKLKSHKLQEEPPSESEFWYHVSFRRGKVRRIALKIEKKRHRQSKIGDNNVGPKNKRKCSQGVFQV
jgi:hypothetical protein